MQQPQPVHLIPQASHAQESAAREFSNKFLGKADRNAIFSLEVTPMFLTKIPIFRNLPELPAEVTQIPYIQES